MLRSVYSGAVLLSLVCLADILGAPTNSPPSDEDECVLKITIKALQEYEAGITSCSTLNENLKEAEQCPTGDETRTLVNALNSEFTSWCSEGNSSNNNSTSALMPKPSESQQCLLRIVVALLQDEETNGIESCGTLNSTLAQIDECSASPATTVLKEELVQLFESFCSSPKTSAPTTPFGLDDK